MDSKETIENFMLGVTETEEYKAIEYLVFSIRRLYLDYMARSRCSFFEIPEYLKPLVEVVIDGFNESQISCEDMLQYMLQDDPNGWVHYYAYTFIIPVAKGERIVVVKDLSDLFAFVLTGYIIDTFREKTIDITRIAENEVLIHDKNQYGLSIVNGVKFRRDYFVYDNKAYLYSILTNTNVIDFCDNMPGFARIFTEQVTDGNILMRLDERLALPQDQAISYSTLNFEKFRGPQFHFKDTLLRNQKTITVHIDATTADKLLLVVKQRTDEITQKRFWHIEIETLPNMEESRDKDHCITTFLHGMYYPDEDCFVHIDCTKNQYRMSEYLKKYEESSPEVAIDQYTESSKLHYKIWCIEGGKYSREVWYDLMVVSLNKCYSTLLDEMLE